MRAGFKIVKAGALLAFESLRSACGWTDDKPLAFFKVIFSDEVSQKGFVIANTVPHKIVTARRRYLKLIKTKK